MNITAQNEIQPSVSATGENTSTALNSTLSLTDDIWMYPYILRLSTTLFFSLIIFFGLLGNSFVMATLIRWPDMRTAFNLLIANICLADLAVCSVAASPIEDHRNFSRMDLRRRHVLCSDTSARCLRGSVRHHAHRNRV